jgi:RNA dependent RNA polymerase
MATSFSSPSSPHHNHHDAVNAYIERLRQIGVDVEQRPVDWSPAADRSTSSKSTSPAGNVKHLYFKNRHGLEQAISDWERDFRLGNVVSSDYIFNFIKDMASKLKIAPKDAQEMNVKLSSPAPGGHSFADCLKALQLAGSSSRNNIIKSTDYESGQASPTEYWTDDDDEGESTHFATPPESPSPSTRKRKIDSDETVGREPPTKLPFLSFESTAGASVWDISLEDSMITELTEPIDDDDDTRLYDVDRSSPHSQQAALSEQVCLKGSQEMPFRSCQSTGHLRNTVGAASDEYATGSIDDDEAIKLAMQCEAMSSEIKMVGSENSRSAVDEDMPRRATSASSSVKFLELDLKLNDRYSIWFKFELSRVWKETDPLPESILHGIGGPTHHFEEFWTQLESSLGRGLDRPSSRTWHTLFGENRTKRLLSMGAHLEPSQTPGSGHFRFLQDPIRLEKGCRFQRKFGADRFLYLAIPEPKKITGPQLFLRWLMAEHYFLGRWWRAVLIKDIKGKDKQKKKEFPYQVIFFAVRGKGIEPIPVEQLIHWYIPLDDKENRDMPYLKAFSRLELGFSQCDATISFNRTLGEQHNVGNIPADRQLEDTRYNDRNLTFVTDFADCMNDGCSIVSLAAIKDIWNAMGGEGMIPSVIQARGDGTKGVWMRNVATDCTTPSEQQRWINVSKSQRKFAPHDEHDEIRSCLEIVTTSTKAKSSYLHSSFILIMVDRGVPLPVISHWLDYSLARERKLVLAAIAKPEDLIKWLARVPVTTEESSFGRMSLATKVKWLIESGFDPRTDEYVARQVREVIRRCLIGTVTKFRIPLPRSAFLIGVADPTGALKPGEVFISFSNGFAVDQHMYPFLHDRDVLVARYPAVRPSDMQKVRCVFLQELSHLTDVIVFPSTGCIPLASKLAGGDYDGDKFWVG